MSLTFLMALRSIYVGWGCKPETQQ